MMLKRNAYDSTIDHPSEAWVIFSGQTDFRFLSFLKPGFRHCYVLLRDRQQWITVDPLFPYTEIMAHDIDRDFDLPGWLEGRGHKVVKAILNRNIKKPAPVMVFTCVEAVKRILGLHRFLIFTPYQLYRHLRKAHARTAIPHITFNDISKEIDDGKHHIRV